MDQGLTSERHGFRFLKPEELAKLPIGERIAYVERAIEAIRRHVNSFSPRQAAPTTAPSRKI